MLSTATKTIKPVTVVPQKSAGTTFFRKAGEDSFFGTKSGPTFFKAPVQAKLSVSTPDDPQEKEADAVADKVMRMPETVRVQKQEDQLQRKEEAGVNLKQSHPLSKGIQKKADEVKVQAPAAGSVQRSPDKSADKEMAMSGEESGGYMVSRKNSSLHHSDILRQSGRGPPAASIPFEQTLSSSKGGGSALPDGTKQFMEHRFGADFSGVRVHTDATAQQLSRSVNAQAFAHGNDIYFNSGKFSPDSTEGKSLLAHELTHTIQQGASKSVEAPATTTLAKKEALNRKPLVAVSPSCHAAIQCKQSSAATGSQTDIHQKEITSPSAPSPSKQSPASLSNFSVAANGSIHPSTHVANGGQVQSKESQQKQELHEEDNQHMDAPVTMAEPVPAISGNNIARQISRSPSSIQLKRITSPQADPAFKSVVSKVKTTAQKAKTHDPVTKKVKEAQSAAKPPPNEKESKAKDKQVAEMDQQEPGAFDEAKFKAALRAKIAALQLNTLKEAENFKANNGAAAVKGDATSQVSGETDKAAGNIENKTKEAPATGSVAGKEVGPAPAAAPDVAAPAISGQQAAPKPVPAEDVSLQKESQGLDKQMADAKVTEPQLTKSNEPKFTGALAEKKTAQVDAVKRPELFRKDEKGIITSAQATAAGVSKTQLNNIAGARKQKMGGVLSKQQEAKAKDEADRARVAADIEQKFNATKTAVEGILSKLDTDVAAMFDLGISEATKSFEEYVDQEVHNYKVDRYLNRFGGSLLWAADLLLGMPDEVNDIYKRGKDRYIKAMDVVINKVAKLVVGQLNAAKKRIGQGKQEIKAYVDMLPKNLQSVGAEAAKNIQSQFSDLEGSVNSKQNDLVDSLAAKYKAGLENVDKKIADMKEANKGLVDKAIGAIKAVIDAIIEFKNMLLNVLARAAAAIELIIDDPIGFLGNLVAGVKQGIQNFVGNIATHLKNGLMGWLFGTLAQAGITMPKSFDAEGIISLVLQVLGLTYANIRVRAVNIVGEKVVAGLEKAAEIFIVIKNEGVAGLWRMIKEKVEQLKDTVIDAIKSFVTEKIIVAGITWLISLLNPASAFIKACKMIYDVIMFFVTRGKQIMDLVNAVIDSVTAIAKGQIGVAAKAVENALAKALPVAISFLASLLGLDGISEKIKAIITKIQAPINAAIDWVINKAVGLVKAAGKLIGIGKEKDPEKEKADKEEKLDKAISAGKKALAKFSGKSIGKIALNPILSGIKLLYGLTSLEVLPNGKQSAIVAKINPEKTAPLDMAISEGDSKEECIKIIKRIDSITIETSLFEQTDAQGNNILSSDMQERYNETKNEYELLVKDLNSEAADLSKTREKLMAMEERIKVLENVFRIRNRSGNTGGNNIAYGDYSISKGEKNIKDTFVSVSSKNFRTAAEAGISAGKMKFIDVVGKNNPFELQMKRKSGLPNAAQDSERKFVNFLLTEVQGKLLGAKEKLDVRKTYEGFSGNVNINSEMSPCTSCQPNIAKIKTIFNDQVNVVVKWGVAFKE